MRKYIRVVATAVLAAVLSGATQSVLAATSVCTPEQLAAITNDLVGFAGFVATAARIATSWCTGLVELAHPKRALGLAAEARLAGYDKPPYAAFGAVVVGWDVRSPRPVVHPVRMFPEDVLHVLKRRVFRASVRQSDYLRLDGLGLAGEAPPAFFKAKIEE